MMNAPYIWTIINGCFKMLMIFYGGEIIANLFGLYHKWVLQNLDAVFYGGGIAPFIWTIMDGCFKLWMRQVPLFRFPFLDSMKAYRTLPKTYNSLELIINIFATTIFILLLCSYFVCICIFSCLYFVFNCICPPF